MWRKPTKNKKNVEGRRVGHDFYDLLIEALVNPSVSVIEMFQQSTRRLVFLSEVIGVIPAVGVDVSQCEAVIAKHASIRIDAV